MRALLLAALLAALVTSGCLGNAVGEDEPAPQDAADPTPQADTPAPEPTPKPAPEVREPTTVTTPTTETTTLTFHGHFDCAATYLIVAGDCLTILDGASASAPVDPGATTDEAWAFPFRTNATWQRIDVTLTTDAATPLSDGWMLTVEPGRWSGGHPPKFARAQGEAPLTLTLVPDERHPTATTDEVLQSGLGYQLVARAYPVGMARDAAGAGLLGVGAAVDVDFTLTVDLVHTTTGTMERDA